ncbi:MAG: NTP transferase domain-containing protein [Desulfomonile tiedjei]|nr:NTP transferase domain-containing protein [Desulfomonile tiedjei]
MNGDRITAIILAGGYSSRMQDFKPLLELGGMTLLERVIRLFQAAATKDVRVVVGYRAPDLVPLLDQWGVGWVLNDRYQDGMFSSVTAGVATLGPDTDAFFLLPVDIPLVRNHTVLDLIQAYRTSGKSIAYPTFQGRRGHPPLISAGYAEEILLWSGDGGLRSLLRQKEADAAEVPVADEHVVLDMDTRADYQRALAKWKDYDIPSAAECMALLRERFSVKSSLVRHCSRVSELALRLGQALNRHGSRLNLKLIVAAGLLHDISRGRPNHAATAAGILLDLGYPAVAEIVEAHMDSPVPGDRPVCERDVVCLSDKLVQGDLVVSLRKRFQKRLDRHSNDPGTLAEITARLTNALKLQRRIEEMLGKPIDSFLSDPPREEHDAQEGNLPTEAW